MKAIYIIRKKAGKEMSEQKLNQRQLFGMKRENLVKKITQYYYDTLDVASVLDYTIAILIRNALTVNDFALFLDELIRDLFLFAEPNDLLRKKCSYFQNYFTKEEWETVVGRLFKNKTSYFKYTKAARSHYDQLMKPNIGKELTDDRKVAIESVFKDANGKNHKWTLRDADPLKDKKDFKALLEILTTLPIFENNGVRRFTQLVESKRIYSEIEVVVERKILPRKTTNKKDGTKKSQQKSAQKLTNNVADKKTRQTKRTAMPADFDPNSLSEEELLKLVESTIPEDAALTDFHFEYTDLVTGEVSTIPINPKKTSVESRVTPETGNDSVSAPLISPSEKGQTPALAAVGAANDKESENQTNRKKPNKHKRKLLEKFQKR